MPYRSLLLLLLLCSLVLQAESCWYPGPGGLRGAGEDDGNIIDDPEGRCTALPSPILPGLAFIPRVGGAVVPGPLWVVNPVLSSQGLLAFDVDELPPASRVPSWDVAIPADSDGDGVDEGAPGLPIINGVRIESNTLGLITAHNYDEVLFFLNALGEVDNTLDGGLTRYLVSVPGGDVFLATDYPNLPEPGASAQARTAVSTVACVRAPGAKLSEGSPLKGDDCAPGVANSFYSSETTGATVINGKLFVSLSNEAPLHTPVTPFYRPGTVLAFAFAGGGVWPIPDLPLTGTPSVVITEGFNPTDVIGYTTPTTPARHFVLVVVSGVIGTDGFQPVKVVDSESFIEVIDTESLEIVGRYPLGNAALAGVSALDTGNKILAVGSAAERWLYSVDLSRLEEESFATGTLPEDLTAEVVHGEANPFVISALEPGSPNPECVGSIAGMSISDDLSEIYAVDYCDGTLTTLAVGGDKTFQQIGQISVASPTSTPPPAPGSEAEIVKGPGRIAVRPGTPGTSFEGSDIFVLVSQPEGRICAQEVFGK